MEKTQIIFPKRKSKITKARSFKIKGSKLHGVDIELENGDNVELYSIRKKEVEQFKEGLFLEYKLKKLQEINDDGEVIESKNRLEEYTIAVNKQNVQMKPLVPSLDKVNRNRLLFIDIETVGRNKTLPKRGGLKSAWKYHKRNYIKEDKFSEYKKSYEKDSPLFAEYGKIVCVTLGYIKGEDEVRLKSFSSEKEKELLKDFIDTLDKFFNLANTFRFVGMNILNFDLPYIRKRLLSNVIRIPDYLDFQDVKPWDMFNRAIDVNELWKGDTFKQTSLNSLSYCLDLESPKDKIDGSEVHKEYHKNGVDGIVEYCEKDVKSVINIMQKLYNREIIHNFAKV